MKPLTNGQDHDNPQPTYWRDLWRQKKRGLNSTPGFENPGTYWSNRKNVTDLYVKSRTRKSWQGNVDAQLDAMHISTGARVLDIGGGTGTHAVPLAAKGCDVTVIEPSAAMREQLQANLVSAGAKPINILPMRWEDVSTDELGGQFNTVIASYSLSMQDIGEALEKMQKCCCGTVHLFWFLTPPSWARVSRDLWPRIHGTEYPGEPLADILWQVLYEMGIYANLAPERKNATLYPTIEEAVREYFQRLNCSTGEQENILKSYFVSKLHSNEEGLSLHGDSYSAHLWWDTGNVRTSRLQGITDPGYLCEPKILH
jgi:SAM-dependent methyltransferase